ncbi:cobalt ECF transporter T component CbiQ [Solibacillus daqui]|uniref:cobalt ECF transporter T component CbiQ n=1 Tax=Solibacillus daqui TaxID=2912187 RepID=UPI0023659F90|nr:cobalt ECF transporter T component CbiQ [Solibacillus daqui]
MLNIDFLASHNAIQKVAASQKITFSVISLLLVTLLRNNILSVWTLLFMSSVIIFYARIPWKTYVTLLIAPIGFVFAGMIAIVLSISFAQPIPISALWHSTFLGMQLFILPNDLLRAITIFFTSISATSCLYFLILTTPMYEISPVLARLKVPTIIIELIELMYRFIFLLLQTVAQLYTAQDARLGYRTYRISFQSLSLLISALFRSIFFRHQAMSYAMTARNIEQFIIPQQFLSEKAWDQKLTFIAGGFLIVAIALIF